MSNLQKALDLAALGMPVSPWEVTPTGSGKHRKTPLTPHGFSDSVTDPAQIHAWWSQWPNAQVGYVPGRIGFMTLDIDPDAGGYTCVWTREETVDTYDSSKVFYMTPSGGEHRIYRLPQSSADVGPNAPIPGMYGVDRRSGEGGAIWYGAAPTRDQLQSVPLATEWMLRSKVSVVGGAYSGSVEQWLDKHSGKAESATVRNAKDREMSGETAMNALVVNLVRLAAEQHGGVPEALEHVRERWMSQPHSTGTDTQVLGEFQRAMESAIRNLGDDDHDALWQMQEAVRLTEQSRAKAELTPYEQQWAHGAPEPTETAQESTWDEQDLSSVLDGSYVPPVPTILERTGEERVYTFYPGMVNALYGEPESGKTWIALLAVVSVLMQGLHVRYLDYESTPGQIVYRLLLLGATKEAIAQFFHYYKPDEAASGDAYAKLLNSEASLIVLDGVTESYGSFGLDPLVNKDARTWHHTLARPMARLTGAAVVLIDHVSKGQGRSGWALGAQHKKAAMDGAVLLVDVEEPLAPGRVGTLRLDIAKDREGALRAKSGPRKEGRLAPFATFTLDSLSQSRSVATLKSWADSAHLKALSQRDADRQEDVLRFLEDNGGQVGSKNKLAKGLELHDRVVSSALSSLIEAGKVQECKGTNGATGYKLVTE